MFLNFHLPQKKMKKDLEAAFKEVKLHEEGKIQLKTLSEVLDEL